MTEAINHPENRELELIEGYQKAFLESVGKISLLSPESLGDIANLLEANQRYLMLEATYIGDVQEYHGMSHEGLRVPPAIRELITQTYEDSRIIVSRLNLSLNGARIDLINPYEPLLPFASNKIPVKPEANELERNISSYIWIDITNKDFSIHGTKKTIETEKTELIRRSFKDTGIQFPMPETTHYNQPTPVTSGLIIEKAITPEILAGLKEIAQNFPSYSAASVAINMTRNDYIDPF